LFSISDPTRNKEYYDDLLCRIITVVINVLVCDRNKSIEEIGKMDDSRVLLNTTSVYFGSKECTSFTLIVCEFLCVQIFADTRMKMIIQRRDAT